MTHSPADVAELAVLERSGFAESRHFGTLVGLAADGSVAVSLGDRDLPVLPRSSVKPWQAVGCLDTGLRLTGAQTAIAAGSHTGEDAHVATVRQILADAGLDDSALLCPSDWPEDEATRDRLIASGQHRTPVRMNCSGKHAAMLAACVRSGHDVAGYLDPAQPVQQAVRAAIERATGSVVSHVAVDGCGAPLFATTVLGLARAVHGLATAPPGSNEAAVADGMRTHPHHVGGTAHANTEVMRRLPGAICKGGAEGVIVAAAPTGQAVAMKIVDGSPRATTMLALAALRALGVDTCAAGDLAEVTVLGGGRQVGRIRLGADARSAFGGHP